MPNLLRQRRLNHARLLMQSAETGLLGAAGDLTDCDVLVLGLATADTLCALAMAECRRAESRLPGCRVDPGHADVVLVTDLPRDAMAGILRQAAVAIAPGGRLVLRFPRTARREAHEARGILAVAGFTDFSERAEGSTRIVAAIAPTRACIGAGPVGRV